MHTKNRVKYALVLNGVKEVVSNCGKFSLGSRVTRFFPMPQTHSLSHTHTHTHTHTKNKYTH